MKKSRKLLALLMALAMVFALAACGTAASDPTEAPASEAPTAAPSEGPAGDPVELVVFAAASMEETLTEIQSLYAEAAPNVTLVFNFDSSGTLKTQIQEGAACDLFISAISSTSPPTRTSTPRVSTSCSRAAV